MKRNNKTGVIQYIVLILNACITIFPMVWMVLLSLKSSDEVFNSPFALPKVLRWENYKKAWELVNLGVLLKNSVFVTVVACIITIFVAVMASYVIARINFRHNFKVYTFFLFGMMIPAYTIMFPMFEINKFLNLNDTYAALLGPYVAFQIPISILILVGFMKDIPKELEESAFIDGANIWTTLIKIVVPVVKPSIATVGILVGLFDWNEFILALVLISKNTKKTLPVGIAAIAGQYTSNYEISAAAIVISIMPIIIFYMLLQKNIIEGMTAGAVKG